MVFAKQRKGLGMCRSRPPGFVEYIGWVGLVCHIKGVGLVCSIYRVWASLHDIEGVGIACSI